MLYNEKATNYILYNIYTLFNVQLHKALCVQKSFVYPKPLFAERPYESPQQYLAHDWLTHNYKQYLNNAQLSLGPFPTPTFPLNTSKSLHSWRLPLTSQQATGKTQLTDVLHLLDTINY